MIRNKEVNNKIDDPKKFYTTIILKLFTKIHPIDLS